MRLHIDATKGILTWIRADGTRRVAGTADAYGYLCVRHQGRVCKAHRLVYEHVFGPLSPHIQVDHINGVRTDNRIANLRAVTNMENCQNRQRPNKTSTSGVKGVRWHPRLQKYVAQICAAGKVHHLGLFSELTDAANMYAEASAFFHTTNPSSERR